MCWQAYLKGASDCDVAYCNPITNRGKDFVKCMELLLKVLKKAFK